MLKDRRHKEQDVYSQLKNDLSNQLRERPSETIIDHDLWETEEDAVKHSAADQLFEEKKRALKSRLAMAE